jgi:hypothetical protein
MTLSKVELTGLVFAACSATLAFPIAWESHLMNRCISKLQEELKENQNKDKQVDYLIQAVSTCHGS